MYLLSRLIKLYINGQAPSRKFGLYMSGWAEQVKHMGYSNPCLDKAAEFYSVYENEAVFNELIVEIMGEKAINIELLEQVCFEEYKQHCFDSACEFLYYNQFIADKCSFPYTLRNNDDYYFTKEITDSATPIMQGEEIEIYIKSFLANILPPDLYMLVITDNDIDENFNIGIFSSYVKAEETACRYLTSVQGFKDYPCSYEIRTKSIIGNKVSTDKVYMAVGWNKNEASEPADIWESELYTNISAAETALCSLQKFLTLESFVCDCFEIDRCLWEEGFVRV